MVTSQRQDRLRGTDPAAGTVITPQTTSQQAPKPSTQVDFDRTALTSSVFLTRVASRQPRRQGK